MATGDTADGIADQRFEPLPLGAVRPRGWLRRQLEIQAEGSSGHLDEFWSDLADNAWLGGDRQGWERGPYYADGLVPLAFLLEDDDLESKARTWVEGFLDAQDDGWIEPETVADHHDPDDPWPRFVVCKALRQYFEATSDERAVDAVRDFARWLHEHPAEWALEEWAAMRWADLVVTLHWLYDREGEDWVLDVAELATERGYDWTDHFRDFQYPECQPDDVDETDLQMPTHVVNNAMGLKAPAARYRATGEESYLDAVREGVDVLDRFHGQATGVFTGDEHLAGKDPARGTELCAVVESLYSLEHVLATAGDPAFGDRLERIAYNALPATFTPDMWAHQYVQQANQVLCAVCERPWTNDPDANVFGQTPHFGCCQANFHQGWPKFVANLWMRDGDGIAAVAYGPSETTTEAGGERVRVVEETDYPFDDEVTIRIEPDAPATFPLSLRVPGWADEPVLAGPDGERRTPEPGSFASIEREWVAGDEVSVSFDPAITTERRYRGGVTVRRGPLVFARPIASEAKQIGGQCPHADWEFYPTEPWNDGLAVDPTEPAGAIELDDRREPGEIPFDPTEPPVTLTAPGRQVPGWTLEDNAAGPLPASPASGGGAERELTLVPYGSTTLRITEFPLVRG